MIRPPVGQLPHEKAKNFNWLHKSVFLTKAADICLACQECVQDDYVVSDFRYFQFWLSYFTCKILKSDSSGQSYINSSKMGPKSPPPEPLSNQNWIGRNVSKHRFIMPLWTSGSFAEEKPILSDQSLLVTQWSVNCGAFCAPHFWSPTPKFDVIK